MDNFYFIFVDESGNLRYDQREPYFVLGSIIVEADSIADIERRLYVFMRSKGFAPFVELHAGDIIHGSRRTPYAFLTFEFRKQLLRDVIDLIVQLPITILGVVIKKKNAGRKDLETETYEEGVLRSAYRLLVERVCRFLEASNGRGILIIDLPEQKEATMWKFWIRNEVESGRFTNPKVLKSIPLFVDSTTSRLIQIADLVAYIIRRYWSIKDKPENELTRTEILIRELFEKIKQRIRTGSNGRIEGYGIKYWEFLGGLP